MTSPVAPTNPSVPCEGGETIEYVIAPGAAQGRLTATAVLWAVEAERSVQVGAGAASTVKVTGVPCRALGAVPATSTVYVPGGVFAPAVSVSVELPPADTVLGTNEAVAP